MYNNFESIKFVYGESNRKANAGYYRSIKNVNTTYENNTTASGEQLFKINGVAEKVRTLTLPEINKGVGRTDIDNTANLINSPEDPRGLFILNRLRNAPGIDSIDYSTDSDYWLASPEPFAVHQYYIELIRSDGVFSYDGGSYCRGIRPVIKLKGSKFSLSAVGSEGTYKFTPVD